MEFKVLFSIQTNTVRQGIEIQTFQTINNKIILNEALVIAQKYTDVELTLDNCFPDEFENHIFNFYDIKGNKIVEVTINLLIKLNLSKPT